MSDAHADVEVMFEAKEDMRAEHWTEFAPQV